ncbi:hypothetical protein J7382_01045 [Shimia sp. R11_0]|uniref:hypothetical protein n=1 Tax=Shimia sp. R11_0 TaxID=2821096 RepID=UPI001ADB2965|nr:hypothetical protein [Shimia sp. R11_0]MBO9476107.1 hypothetical protein [Shimia sp. R11_0]
MSANSVSHDTLPIVILKTEADALEAVNTCFDGKLTVSEQQRHDSLGAGLKLRPKGAVLVPLRTPSAAVTALLSQGISLPEALNQWRDQGSEILKSLRTRRRDVTLVSLEGMLSGDPAVVDVLQSRFGIAVKPAKVAPAQDSDLWFASIAISQDKELQALADSLLAFLIGASPQTQASQTHAMWQQVSSWRTAVSDLEARVAQLDETAKSAEQERALLKDNLAKQLEQTAQHSATLEAVSEEKKLLRESLDSHLSQLAETTSRADGLKGERDLLRESLSAQAKEVAKASTESQALTAERALLRESLSAQSAEVAKLTASIGDLDAERSLLRESLTSQSEEVAKLSASLNEIKQERALLRENLAGQLEQLSARQQAVDVLSEETALLRESLAAQVTLVTQAHGELSVVLQEQQLLRSSLSDQLQITEKNTKQIEGLRKERGLLQKTVQTLMVDIRALTESVTDKETRLAEARVKLMEMHVLRAENEAQDRRLRQAEDQRKAREEVLGQHMLDMQSRMVQQHKEIDALQEELEGHKKWSEEELARRAESAKKSGEARDSALGQAMLQLQDSFNRQTKELEALAQELDRVYGSNSWRITSPIRAVRSKFTKGAS